MISFYQRKSRKTADKMRGSPPAPQLWILRTLPVGSTGRKDTVKPRSQHAARGKISDLSQKLFSEAFNLSGLVWGLLVVREGLAKKERSVRPQAET